MTGTPRGGRRPSSARPAPGGAVARGVTLFHAVGVEALETRLARSGFPFKKDDGWLDDLHDDLLGRP